MKTHPNRSLLILILGSFALFIAAVCVGSTGFSAIVAAWLPSSYFSNHTSSASIDAGTALQIILELRLPRALGAWLAGCLLGLAGALSQGLFRNPLADPYLLGSASGAGLFVAFFMWLMLQTSGVDASTAGSWWGTLGVTGFAFAGSLLAVFLALFLARGSLQSLKLLLAGIIVGIVFSAMTQVIFVKEPALLIQSQFFMLGSTTYLSWQSCAFMAVALVCCLLISFCFSRVLDALKLGEETARSLGISIGYFRLILIGTLAFATASSVAQTGLIAFVGLVAPHMARSAHHLDSGRIFILRACLYGGILLLMADTCARTIMAPAELPVGILTAIFGGGYLLWLMLRQKQNTGTML